MRKFVASWVARLYGINRVVIAALMHCELFKIYCASPNLGITRTWKCRLNFAQRPIFSGFRFFNEPEISDSGHQLTVRRTCAQEFYVLKKIHRPQPDLNPRTLDLEASTLPRNHRGRRVARLLTPFQSDNAWKTK